MKVLIFWAVVGVTVCGGSCFSPPVVNISLDVPAEQRWEPLLKIFDKDFLRKAAAEVIDTTVPKWVHTAVSPIVKALEKYVPQPYAGEIRGMASYYQSDISDIVILNFAYEVSAFCTSIVAQNTKGNIYHGRNLDYPHDVLKNLTVDILFIKNGQVAYRGTSFAGYVGLWTGQSAKKFTVSGDQRDKGYWWENVISAFLLKSSPVSWLVRETLAEATDFQNAVMRLAKVPIITDVYYIVGGVQPNEGVVITRDRRGPADIWPLDWNMGQWYLVETNYDHWLPTPKRDIRRDVAMKALNATGQNNINMRSLYQVLSVVPVCNSITVYTTVMSAAAPDEYKTMVRETCDESF
ncbi:N-acylethanolamine-hydrolyzing acid amidase-like [Colossoma macropomum]|uniref:N-acylethanolamine-hydrolyzing acid amidase-like n=1 Tax=Colossoma macropomum TaxID=42526 RepID=UPI001863FFF2|nr:N-acylethanolamine-hydrolyzing acid amidase-like [Colossoma macropomum]